MAEEREQLQEEQDPDQAEVESSDRNDEAPSQAEGERDRSNS